MFFLSLIHGADGIAYYSYNHVTGKEQTSLARERADLWASVKRINAELREIGEFLLESAPAQTMRVTPRESAVEWRAAARDGSVVILLANTSPEPQTVSVRWTPPSAVLRRVDNDVEQPVENGVAEITLAEHEALALRSGE
jgi:hypothetical protein